MPNSKLIWNKPRLTIANSEQLVDSILQERGLTKDQRSRFLNPSYQADLADPFLMIGMDKAVDRIYTAIKKHEKVVIYGDYDIDGLTATTLLFDLLHPLNEQVEAYIPDRFEEGYGLNTNALKYLADNGTNLVITVDCGITSAVEVSEAAQLGLDIIVTDHHTIPERIPERAVAVINPKQQGDKYPYKDLAGVGVAFALARALQQKYPELLALGQEKWLLDLVAFGTVCDVVELTGENRVLVYYGLAVLRQSRRAGIQALAEASAVTLNQIKTDDLGFRLGPRLNAAGRLEHAKKSLELLLSSDIQHAHELAAALNLLNSQRQSQTAEIFNAADQQANKFTTDPVLVLADTDWSHGVAGLVASRISERWHKPAIILQILGDQTKGSARSFGNCNIIEAITACSKDLVKFGGHAFAAGLTLPTDKIDDFRRQINKFVSKNYTSADFDQRLNIDAVLDSGLLELQKLSDLKKLEPYGNANPAPLFVSQVDLVEARLIGQENNHVKFRFRTPNGQFVDGISFNSAHRWPDGLEPGPVEIAYRVSENVWQDIARLQLEVIGIRSPN